MWNNLEFWSKDTLIIILVLFLYVSTFYFSFWLFITGIIGGIRMLRSRNWKSTTGIITNTEIRFKKFGGGGDSSVNFKFVRLNTYSYVVNGKKYESNQNFASDSLYQKDYKPLSKFPNYYKNYRINLEEDEIKTFVGQNITVYYDPINPKNACLINKFNKEILIPIFMGLLFSSGIIYITYFFIFLGHI